MVNASVSPLRLRRNARQLEQFIRRERVDIIHAYDVGAAWSARLAAAQVAVWLVTALPDNPDYAGKRGRYGAALAQGDRIIAPSNYAAAPVIERYGVREEQITVVPHVIDTASYDPPPYRRIAPPRNATIGGSGAANRSWWCPGGSPPGMARTSCRRSRGR